MKTVYLDHNAAAPLRPEAKAAMLRVLEMTGNPSSVHAPGRALRGEIETAREAVADLTGARPDDVIFMSGGTEANNAALKGCGAGRLIASAGEHDSVLKTVSQGEVIPLRSDGVVDLEALDQCLGQSSSPPLVSVMMANNETGVLNPLEEITARVRKHGGWVHSDAVQAAGKTPVDMAALSLDYLTLSAHKIGGPRGVGALVLREGAPFSAQIVGGGQERGRRAGTEDAAAIVGFGAAARAALADLNEWSRVAALRDGFEDRLMRHAAESVIFGRSALRLPNTCCFALPGLSGETQVMHLDLAGIAVSAGAACSSGKVELSPVLLAMGAAPDLAACAIRISLGLQNSQADLDGLFEQWMALRCRAAEHGGLAA